MYTITFQKNGIVFHIQAPLVDGRRRANQAVMRTIAEYKAIGYSVSAVSFDRAVFIQY